MHSVYRHGNIGVSGTGLLILIPALLFPALLSAQTGGRGAEAARTTPEQRAARALEAARANPLALREFLVRMPKGADLHNHLSGAVYAESWIRAGAEDKLCVTLATLSFSRPAANGTGAEPTCGEGTVPASKAYTDQHLFDSLVNAFSMRGFVPSAGVTGHDHFFDTFAKFGGTDKRHTGEWVDEAAGRAAAQNEQYLELMVTPPFTHTAAVAKEIGWRDDLASLREALLARGLRDDLKEARGFFDQAETVRRERGQCGKKEEAPGCRVQVRYIYQVLRRAAREVVFAQTLLGFEVASTDPRVVAINLVQPEDSYVAMNDYALHMHMLGFLHDLYPPVHIALHAGELAPGLVPPEGLCCHVRLAVEQGHAERIGHGVDVMYEERPYELLKEMAARHVMVEINLTSNDEILGITGKDHTLSLYRQFHVPVALSTDDEGVSRIDLTHEYVRAAQTYGFRYGELKGMARTSLEHSFLPGTSLWSERDSFTRAVAACAHDAAGTGKPSPNCAAFLSASEKARQQWELERRFRAFEASF